jgi:hypothetical protein
MVIDAIGGVVHEPVLFVGGLTVVCFAISFVLRWQAAAPLITIALAPVASSAGMDPWIIAIVTLMACNTFFVPYQNTQYLMLYQGSGGHLFTHLQAQPAAVAYAIVVLLALCASVPVWRVMGLL